MTDRPDPGDDASRNRAFWDGYADTYQADHGPQLAMHGAAWGVWQIPEDELRILGEVAGRDVLAVEDAKQLVFDLDDHALAELCCEKVVCHKPFVISW